MEGSLEQRAAGPSDAEHDLTLGEKLVRLLRESAIKWNADKAPRLGAALAYYTVFSLAPLLIIAIVIAGAIFGQAAAQQQIVGQISYLMGPEGAAGVSTLIAQRPFPGQSGTIATIVSVITLTLGAVGVFGQLQDAFDTVWDVTPPPARGITGFLKRRVMPFGMVLAVGFLLLVTTLLNTVFAAMSTALVPRIPFFGPADAIVNILLPLAVITLLFAAMFRFVPDVHPAWRDLWPGAGLTAVLFTVGKVAIGLYLGHSSLGSASGAVGSLLVVLVWVYYSAQILLFGAVFTHVYIRYHGQQTARHSARPSATAPADVGSSPDQSTAPQTQAGPGRPASVLSSHIEAPPRPGCLGALLGFVAGLGAGVWVALRNQHQHRGSGSAPGRTLSTHSRRAAGRSWWWSE